ncbi:MAG TPA: amidohydrolase family protein [Acidimicrobiales bacterium]|nr:amidohydrolase family protein [Acidimicrobiales bacterium]
MPVDFGIVDMDTHYYEPDDAWTRYLEPGMEATALHVERDEDGTACPYFGADPIYRLPMLPRDRIQRPGAFVADKDGRFLAVLDEEEDYVVPGDIPWYVRREARLEWMDQKGIEAAVLWPSLGLVVERQMRSDPAACQANLRAFNRWLDEEWGFDHQDRLFAAPWLSLCDRDAAVAELDHVLARGARVVALLAGPVTGRSPADPYFDPFWARLAEARVPAAFHAGDFGYNEIFGTQWGERPWRASWEQSPLQQAIFSGERPVVDTLAALVLHNLFGRFPTLEVLTVENGSAWVPYLLRVMDKGARMGARGEWLGGRLDDVPSDVFKHHVTVAPLDDDDIRGLVDTIGVQRVVLGSDYPHPEGLVEPVQFLEGIGLDREELMLVGRDNGARLLQLPQQRT